MIPPEKSGGPELADRCLKIDRNRPKFIRDNKARAVQRPRSSKKVRNDTKTSVSPLPPWREFDRPHYLCFVVRGRLGSDQKHMAGRIEGLERGGIWPWARPETSATPRAISGETRPVFIRNAAPRRENAGAAALPGAEMFAEKAAKGRSQGAIGVALRKSTTVRCRARHGVSSPISERAAQSRASSPIRSSRGTMGQLISLISKSTSGRGSAIHPLSRRRFDRGSPD